MHSFGILRSVERQFLTDVWGQAIAPIFKSQAVYSWTAWPLKMTPAGCTKTSVRTCHSTLRKIRKDRRSHTAAKAWNLAKKILLMLLLLLLLLTVTVMVMITIAIAATDSDGDGDDHYCYCCYWRWRWWWWSLLLLLLLLLLTVTVMVMITIVITAAAASDGDDDYHYYCVSRYTD